MASETILDNPIPPATPEKSVQDEVSVEVASQWQLMWMKFRKHRLALLSGIFILVFYFISFFAGFFTPLHKSTYFSRLTLAPPQQVHLFDNGQFAPYVYGYEQVRDPLTFETTYEINREEKIPLGFFVRGDEYQVGLQGIPFEPFHSMAITLDIHLFGPVNQGDYFFPFGSDELGRDVFSRIIYSSQVSLSIGLVGVFLSLTLGILFGGLSGLIGGWVDNIIQRIIELLRSIPDIPLWMALAAAIPPVWNPVYVYFAISIILSLLGWTNMARVVRGKFLSLREEDFILAAELDGVPRRRIIFKHMIPSFLSHIIASVTLAVPGMILAETALSFLGLGLKQPVVSWGVMLKNAQDVQMIANAPWMLFPGLAVVVIVLAFNFFGDGLRDAADPYH